MTRTSEVEVDCPGCGSRQTAPLCDAVGAEAEPHLREEILTGRINTFLCDACGYEGFLDGPLMYYDMNRQYCVQYLPEEVLEDPENLEGFTADGKWNVDLDLPAGGLADFLKEPHVVFDLDEMRRYIVFRELLHDRDAERPQNPTMR
ncbi:MAG: CpXC domain-containing protein [Deltaproteobacteria bacterium]|nr:CpXC domain-containing protein [Deltaproteobacteria bacterium]